MPRLYLEQQINISIYIDKNDIDATDIVNIYETTSDPSGAGELIATVKSIETDLDPSTTGDAYLFVFKKRVVDVGNYSFYYTISDSAKNESALVNSFDIDVCLTPMAPAQIPPEDLVFIDDLSTSTAAHYTMDDNDTNAVVVNEEGTNGTYSDSTSTEDRSVPGVIGTALNFIGDEGGGDGDYIDTNQTFESTFQDSFSINFWAKPDEGQPGGRYNVISVIDESEMTIALDEAVFIVNYQTDEGYLRVNATGDFFAPGPASDFTMGTVTFENITDTNVKITIYKNGVFFYTDTSTSGNIAMGDYSSTYNPYIGVANDVGEADNFYEGDLDDVSIFNKVLSEDEVGYLYAQKEPTTEFFNTVYHYPSDTPASITDDGDFGSDAETYYLFTPAPDGEYQYFKTTTDEDCLLESGNSPTTPILIASGEKNTIPLSDPFNLFLNNAVDGSFVFLWNYNATANDPINKWRIYHNILDDISDSTPNWELEDTTDMVRSQTNLFSYVTDTNIDSEIVEYKIVPTYFDGVDYFERDNDITVIGTADAQAPTVITDYIYISLE